MIKFKIQAILLTSLIFLVSGTQTWAATLSLSPSSGNFNKGCGFNLDMALDTQGAQTDGADAIILYDTSRFKANSVTTGTIYPDYPGTNIDETAGKITISGLSSVSSAFSGKGNLASINFTVKTDAQTGVSQMKFDFDPNDKAKTTDSNVVERGTVADILNSVGNGSYTVGTGTCGSSGSGGSTGTGSGGTISTPSGGLISSPAPGTGGTLPNAGSQELTATIAIVGITLAILGILGLAIL